jgi:biotin carboxyl carrier protein
VKYHVLVGEQHVEVDVRRDGGGYAVTLDGEVLHVDVAALAEGQAYSLIVGLPGREARSVDVAVEERPRDGLDLLVGGRRYSTTVLNHREWAARSIQGGSAAVERVVRAVMTGIVREVLVAPGDVVAAGQTLFILEAMKMENEVKAQAAGTVKALAVTAGQTVTQGDVVAEIA